MRRRAAAVWKEAVEFERERRAEEDSYVDHAGDGAFEEMSAFFAGRVVHVDAAPVPQLHPGASKMEEGEDVPGDAEGGETERTTIAGATKDNLTPAEVKASAKDALLKGAAAMQLAIKSRIDELVNQQRLVLSRAQDVVQTDLSLTSKDKTRRITIMKLIAGADNAKVGICGARGLVQARLVAAIATRSDSKFVRSVAGT